MSSEGSRALQETLHILLSRLASTMDHVQNWPSEQASASSHKPTSTADTAAAASNIHVSSTSQLIHHLNQVVTALQRVEGTIKADSMLRKSLQECAIPLDLLDLLDSSKLNPDVFGRGLLREALGQLAGLRRRKLALELLGAAVQTGMNKRKLQQEQLGATSTTINTAKSAPVDNTTTITTVTTEPTKTDDDVVQESSKDEPPPAKKQRME